VPNDAEVDIDLDELDAVEVPAGSDIPLYAMSPAADEARPRGHRWPKPAVVGLAVAAAGAAGAAFLLVGDRASPGTPTVKAAVAQHDDSQTMPATGAVPLSATQASTGARRDSAQRGDTSDQAAIAALEATSVAATTKVDTLPSPASVSPAATVRSAQSLGAQLGPSKFTDQHSELASHGVPVQQGRQRPWVAISQQAIMAVLAKNYRGLNACYNRALKRDYSQSRMRVAPHVKISGSGRVAAIGFGNPAVANSQLGACLTQNIRRWRFPASGVSYETEFPILFQGH
jgi:hypothetical protein